MEASKLAEENYRRFCHFEGSKFIASEFALFTILKLINKFSIQSVLEIGVGIGSITDTVMKMSELKGLNLLYVGTEANEYCKQSIKRNVFNHEKIELFENIEAIGLNRFFDLIIIDGQDDTLFTISQHIKKNSIIFIEGDRTPQREEILKQFPKSLYVNTITLQRNRSYAHGYTDQSQYIGGGHLIFVRPTFKMKWFWMIEKVKTYLKRKIRINRTNRWNPLLK